MNDLNAHAGWFRDVRRILDITEVTPGLPLPSISRDRAVFFFVGAAHAEDAREAVRLAETILRSALLAVFYPRRTQAGSTRHYILTALLPSGLTVDIVALAEHIDGPEARETKPELAEAAA
jgi:hypothetical protein